MANKKDERQSQIYHILLDEGRVSVKTLASRLQVTPETIRSDLTDMEDQRRVIREHGFARPLSTLEEVPVQMREQENLDDKRRAAMRAMEEIEDNQTIFLDSGSTIILGLPALSFKNVTIVTNGIPLAYEAGLLGYHTIFCGGEVSNVGLRTHGHFCIDVIDRIQFDVALMGTDGLVGASSFTALAFNEISIKEHIMAHSKKNIVVGDRSKFEKKAAYNIGNFRDIDILVTNPLTEQERRMVREIKQVIEV